MVRVKANVLTSTEGSADTSLEEFTKEARKTPVINWYRTPIGREEMKILHERSDFLGFIQTAGYLGILVGTIALTIYSAWHWPWWATVAALALHGTVSGFHINAVHELGHGTVFKTRWLNRAFCHIFAFLGWINHEKFYDSHTRHHRYTLHPPDDLEVVLPFALMIRHVFKTGIVNPRWAWSTLQETIRIARGRFRGDWELTLYPESQPEKRMPTVRWARFLLVGHGAVALVSVVMGWWIVPVVVTLSPYYGSWLFFFCNNTQHIGLKDNVPDFRLCCRTYTLNPCIRFLYWQMNYHTEHHMYAAVPCYRLKRLHCLIRYDLPPAPHGLVAVWKEIYAILQKQKVDPAYQHQMVLPPGAAPPRLGIPRSQL